MTRAPGSGQCSPVLGRSESSPPSTDDRDDRDGTGERDANGPRTIAEWPHHRTACPCSVIAMAAGFHVCEKVISSGIA